MIYSRPTNSAVLRTILSGLIWIIFVTEISAIKCEYCNKGFVNADVVRRHEYRCTARITRVLSSPAKDPPLKEYNSGPQQQQGQQGQQQQQQQHQPSNSPINNILVSAPDPQSQTCTCGKVCKGRRRPTSAPARHTKVYLPRSLTASLRKLMQTT